jgi:hypothetical protein
MNNSTIVTNWDVKKFSCKNNCSYCSWRKSKYLPHGCHKVEDVRKYIEQSRKNFVTISGGAEPLFEFEKNKSNLFELCMEIERFNKKVRIITREVETVIKLINLKTDFHFSISLDDVVFEQVKRYHDILVNYPHIEFSLVMPPFKTEQVLGNIFDLYKLRESLPGNLVLRENLDSIFELDYSQLTFKNTPYYKSIMYCPKESCLRSSYLVMEDYKSVVKEGYDLMQDYDLLFKQFEEIPDIYYVGGMVKHILYPEVYPTFSDIDIVTCNKVFINILEDKFKMKVDRRCKEHSVPKYYSAVSDKMNAKELHIIELPSKEDVEHYIFNSQYDIDRIYLDNNWEFNCDTRANFKRTLENSILIHLRNKEAELMPDEITDRSKFGDTRRLVEMKYKAKLFKKGFKFV